MDPSPLIHADEGRRPVSAEAIKSVVCQIVEQSQPECVILSGSHAFGQPRLGSDVDPVVINTSLKDTDQAVHICQTMECHFGLDLIVRTPATLDWRLALGDSFLQEAITQAVILHERTDR